MMQFIVILPIFLSNTCSYLAWITFGLYLGGSKCRVGQAPFSTKWTNIYWPNSELQTLQSGHTAFSGLVLLKCWAFWKNITSPSKLYNDWEIYKIMQVLSWLDKVSFPVSGKNIRGFFVYWFYICYHAQGLFTLI